MVESWVVEFLYLNGAFLNLHQFITKFNRLREHFDRQMQLNPFFLSYCYFIVILLLLLISEIKLSFDTLDLVKNMSHKLATATFIKKTSCNNS